MRKDVLNLHQVESVAKHRPDLKSIAEEVVGYNRLIVKDAVAALANRQMAVDAWSMAIDGLQRFPFTMPLGDRRLSDHPDVIHKVMSLGFDSFYDWYMSAASDDGKMQEVCEQVVFRNVFHFFEYTVRMGSRIPNDGMEVMRKEFAAPDYKAPTKWVSQFFNGLQTCVIEEYIKEKFFSTC